MAIAKVSTNNMSHEQWLEERRNSIGGSDAAGVIGLSPYSSPYSVWADKLGITPPKEDTEAMRLGRDLEEYVAKRFEEATGKKVRRLNAILRNTDYPFAHADLDRVVVGENAILECKTTSTLNIKQFKDTEFPDKYYCQCVHYLAVTGWQRVYLAVLVFGKGFFVYTLERDEEEIAALMNAEGTFWREYVETKTPPPADGTRATTDTIETIYKESTGDSIELFGRDAILDKLFELKSQKAETESAIAEIENTIKLDMEDAEAATCGNYKVSWKNQTRSTFQAKEFQKDYPELDLSPYFKTSTTRPFKVTKAG